MGAETRDVPLSFPWGLIALGGRELQHSNNLTFQRLSLNYAYLVDLK